MTQIRNLLTLLIIAPLVITGCAIAEPEPLPQPEETHPAIREPAEEATPEKVAQSIEELYNHLQTINTEELPELLKTQTELYPPQPTEYLISVEVGNYIKNLYNMDTIIHRITLTPTAEETQNYLPLLYLSVALHKEKTLLREHHNPNYTYKVEPKNITIDETGQNATHEGYITLLDEAGLALIAIEKNLNIAQKDGKWAVQYETPITVPETEN